MRLFDLWLNLCCKLFGVHTHLPRYNEAGDIIGLRCAFCSRKVFVDEQEARLLGRNMPTRR